MAFDVQGRPWDILEPSRDDTSRGKPLVGWATQIFTIQIAMTSRCHCLWLWVDLANSSIETSIESLLSWYCSNYLYLLLLLALLALLDLLVLLSRLYYPPSSNPDYHQPPLTSLAYSSVSSLLGHGGTHTQQLSSIPCVSRPFEIDIVLRPRSTS